MTTVYIRSLSPWSSAAFSVLASRMSSTTGTSMRLVLSICSRSGTAGSARPDGLRSPGGGLRRSGDGADLYRAGRLLAPRPRPPAGEPCLLGLSAALRRLPLSHFVPALGSALCRRAAGGPDSGAHLRGGRRDHAAGPECTQPP